MTMGGTNPAMVIVGHPFGILDTKLQDTVDFDFWAIMSLSFQLGDDELLPAGEN